MLYVDLMHNLAALISLSVLSFFIDSRWPAKFRTGSIAQGVLFGLGSVLVMLSPVDFMDGVIFDSRSVALSVVSLYFGPFAGLTAGTISLAARLMIGGAGWLSGSITIILSVGIGLIYFNRRRLVLEPPSVSFLYVFGLVAHAIILIGVYVGLPDDRAIAILSVITVPMLTTYPLATVLIGKILSTLVRTRIDLFTVTQGKTFFQSLFREHAAIKLIFDAHSGSILDANDAALRFYGWNLEEMKAMRIQEINTLSEEDVAEEMAKARTLKRNYFTFRHRLKNGEIRSVDVFSSPLHIDGRDYLYSIIHDVTERIKAEEQIALQISALNSASNAIVITDTDGAILWANRAFSEVTGFGADEALGRNPRDLVKSGMQPKPYYSVMWDTILKGDVWKGELVNKKKDGSLYYEEMTITPVTDRNGKITHFIAIKQDITDRKVSEKLLLQNYEELKKTNAELDRFVYSTSHDLRAPLLSVLGLIDLSREVMERSPEALSYLDMMRDGIKRSDETIKQILTYSRNSRLKLSMEAIDVRALVENHIHDIRHMKEASGIRFEVDIPEPSVIESDSMRFRTILQNLITNAVKYQREDEPDPYVRIRMRSEDGSHVISVEDNGEGIPADRLDSVFEMFQRNSNKSTGSGLGLYMVREMTARLGGTVSVTSAAGQGSTFTVRLPILTNAAV